MTLVTADLMGGTKAMSGESDCKEGGAPQQGRWVQSQLGSLRVPGGMGIWTVIKKKIRYTYLPLEEIRRQRKERYVKSNSSHFEIPHIKYLSS